MKAPIRLTAIALATAVSLGTALTPALGACWYSPEFGSGQCPVGDSVSAGSIGPETTTAVAGATFGPESSVAGETIVPTGMPRTGGGGS